MVFNTLGIDATQKSGTDVLLDLLSIGTPASQSNSSMLDVLSPVQDNKSSVDMLNGLSSPAPSVQTPSRARSSPMMDLMDGFGPTSSVPGTWSLASVHMFLLNYFIHVIFTHCFELQRQVDRPILQLLHLRAAP